MTDVNRSFPDLSATVDPLLVVADLATAMEWWHGLLGAQVIERIDGYVLLAIGDGHLHLAEVGPAPPDRDVELVPPLGSETTASAEVVISVANCHDVVRALQVRGVEFLGPPATPPWGGEVRAFARDPDGHLVEFLARL